MSTTDGVDSAAERVDIRRVFNRSQALSNIEKKLKREAGSGVSNLSKTDGRVIQNLQARRSAKAVV